MAATDMKEMSRWAAEDWAAFGLSLWELHGNIMADPAYIDAGVDILVGLRTAIPHVNLELRKYCADTADVIADLCCERIRNLADDCRWDARQVIPQHSATSGSGDDSPDEGDSPDLPPEWFDVLGDDDD